MNVSDAKSLRDLKGKNASLKRLLADAMLVKWGDKGNFERPGKTEKGAPQNQLLVQRHRCYGAGMIYLELR